VLSGERSGRASMRAGSIRFAAGHDAPRMKNTAHIAHIAQIPVTTIHFSMSPIL
jgi:hypothetical protein